MNKNVSEKIGLWAYERLGNIYFQEFKLKSLIEKFLNSLIPKCSHEECCEVGEPCFLSYSDDGNDVIQWVCYKHMHEEGFCKGCHQFWSGAEDFDFDPHGLCSNCRHNPDFGFHEDNYESEGWEDAIFDEATP